MNRISTFLLLAILSYSFISCAPSAETQQADSSDPESQRYPEWYQAENVTSVTSSDSLFSGYGTALAGDSTTAEENAETQAKLNLRSAVANILETIRSDASSELDSEAGVDSPQFIFSLRKAEKVVDDLAVRTEVEAEPVEDYNGYRGFTKVTVSKEELLNRLDSRLSAHEKAWNALKASQAFEEF